MCGRLLSAPSTGDLAHNPGELPDWESNRRPFGSQAGTQSTEQHQPSIKILEINLKMITKTNTVQVHCL